MLPAHSGDSFQIRRRDVATASSRRSSADAPGEAVNRASATRSGPLHVTTFDGVRGLVVLAVVVAHIFGSTHWAPRAEFLLGLRRSMFFSVDFLFLISGFVLFLPVVARGSFGSVRSYALRRVGRIVPSYYVSIAITVGLLALVGPSYPAPHEATAVLAHLSFVQFQAYFPLVGLGINAVWWTLSTIVLFYITLPLIAEGYLRRPWLGLALALSIAGLWQLWLPDLNLSSARWSAQYPHFLDDFAIGMTAAVVYVALKHRFAAERMWRASVWALVTAGGTLVYVLYRAGAAVARGETTPYVEGPLLSIAVPLAFAIVVVALALAPPGVQWPLSKRAARWLGDVSLGVFLYHMIVVYLALELLGIEPDGDRASMLALAAVVLPSTLVVAWLSAIAVERPLRARIRGFADRQPPADQQIRSAR